MRSRRCASSRLDTGQSPVKGFSTAATPQLQSAASTTTAVPTTSNSATPPASTEVVNRTATTALAPRLSASATIRSSDCSRLSAINGPPLYESALLAGHPDLAQHLADHGAEIPELDAVQRFVAACMAADDEATARLLDGEPGLVARTQDAQPGLLDNAASANRLDAMRLMIALGFDLNRLDGRPPLHQAGFHNHVDMAKLLLGGGANLGLRENEFAATPLQWAVTAGSHDVADYLADRELGIFDAVLVENLGRITALLDTSPTLLEATIGTERSRAPAHAEDWQTPLAFAVVQKRPASVKLLLERGANAEIADRDGRTLVEIARERSTPEITGLLRPSRA